MARQSLYTHPSRGPTPNSLASVRRLQEQLEEKNKEKNAENGSRDKPEYQRLPVKKVLLQLSFDYTKSTPERLVHEGENYYCFSWQHLMDTVTRQSERRNVHLGSVTWLIVLLF